MLPECQAITGCGDWQMALELLAQMDCRAVQKDAFGYSAIIRASVKRSEWLRALHFLTSMEQLAIKDPSSVAFNAALSADFLGDWRKTLDMLLTGRARRTQITEITFSTAIAACENGMQQQLALSLLWDAEARYTVMKMRLPSCHAEGECIEARVMVIELFRLLNPKKPMLNARLPSAGSWSAASGFISCCMWPCECP